MGFTADLVSELDAVGNWGLITTDTDLRITGWNRWMERYAGDPSKMVLGKLLFDNFPELGARKFDHYYRQVLEGQTVVLSQALHKYVLLLPPPSTGDRVDCMQQTVRIVPITRDETVCGTVTVIEDVTERVSFEAELRERVEALREADRRKDEFLAMLAHELRNPLAPIRNAVQIIRLTGTSEPTIDHARGMIERQVDHLVRLVDDLLDVSRVSRGKIQLQKGVLDLSVVVRQAIETSRPQIDARKHNLIIKLPADVVRVEGDFTRLAQVISNLLNNAAKYTEEGGEIRVSVETEKRSGHHDAVIRVRDTGRGIDPTVLPHLFDLFYQVDRNLDRAEGGLGIGLSLVRNLVEMHDGQVEAHSAGRGRGSEFVVRLPLVTMDEAQTQKSTLPLASNAGRDLRILVVDDNRDSAESMATLLEMDGHAVSTAHDGDRAVQIALAQRPDVVLLDIGLPGMNGFQACQAMREGGLTNTLLVAITGYGREEDRQLTLQAGFDAHLVKPPEFQAIRQLLAELSAE